MSSRGPVEAKVVAGTVGAGAGAIVSSFVNWGLDSLFWNGDAPPPVPEPVQGLVTLVVTGAFAFVAAYSAKHTFRSDPDAVRTGKHIAGVNNAGGVHE